MRRKRTPKKRLRVIADRLWSHAVRSDWNWRCAVCQSKKVEAHHLIPRTNYATRYDIWNGIALCCSHHKFDARISPHLNAAGWLNWLSIWHPERHAWYVDTPNPMFVGTKNDAFFLGAIRSLREYVDDAAFESIVGIKLSRELEPQSDD